MTTPDTFLWVYTDDTRGLALIRGRQVRDALRLADAEKVARWSAAGKGYVVPLSAIPDLVAMCEWSRIPVRTRQVTPT
jgi:hypothetical protein